MNASDVLASILFARDQGADPAAILDENSPLMDAAREALKPTAAAEAEHCARSLLALASWSTAPVRNEWGDGMMAADIALTNDETMTIYAHRDALPAVGAA